MKVYALRSPRGRIVPETVSLYVRDNWSSEAFDYLANRGSPRLRHAMPWKEWGKARDAAARFGWRVVEVELVEKRRAKKSRRKDK